MRLRSPGRLRDWLFTPVPRGRIAALRTLAYLFIVVDVLVYTPEAAAKAVVPTQLYQPLAVDRLLPGIPEPTPGVVHAVYWGLLLLAPLAATGRAPRLLGWLLLGLYFEWMLIDMSYGKVDHDRFAFLVALAVLPTVGAARHGDPRPSQSAGWAVRMVQLGVVATYFLAALAKLRFGGVEWLWGTTLTWAVLRRGTVLARWTLRVPWLLGASQVGIVAFELISPLILVLRERWQRWMVAYFYLFHLVTWLAIGISFAPHLVAMTGFLPLERVRPLDAARQWLSRRASAGATAPTPS